MNSGNYLSKIILFQSILISTLVFWALPLLLEKSSGNGTEIEETSIRDTWQEEHNSLPVPTVFALKFADHRVLRWGLFSVLVAGGVLIEMLCQNTKTTGTYHSLHLMLCTLWGAFFLLGCIVPYIPL